MKILTSALFLVFLFVAIHARHYILHNEASFEGEGEQISKDASHKMMSKHFLVLLHHICKNTQNTCDYYHAQILCTIANIAKSIQYLNFFKLQTNSNISISVYIDLFYEFYHI